MIVEHSSDRGLCALAEGLFHGIADHYDTEFRVVQRTCMHEDGDVCEFFVEEVAHTETDGTSGDPDSDDREEDPTRRTREVRTISHDDEN